MPFWRAAPPVCVMGIGCQILQTWRANSFARRPGKQCISKTSNTVHSQCIGMVYTSCKHASLDETCCTCSVCCLLRSRRLQGDRWHPESLPDLPDHFD